MGLRLPAVRRYAVPGLLLAAALGTVPATGDSLDQLRGLSLDELSQVRVSIASRYPQAVADAAAAVTVLTRDDIHRSGATSIPELLRLVPGLQVARINGNTWAVSARGFNDQFANKLLVLVDGRSVYTPLFSGVFWDVQDTLLQDIDRIEVVRGPGASLWGANAVNGVINIVTRHAADTRGTLLEAGGGDHERAFAGGRRGWESDGGDWRAYAKAFDRAASDGGHDAWRMLRTGFRGDLSRGSDAFTLQGDLYRGTEEVRFQPRPSSRRSPLFVASDEEARVTGGNLVFSWRRRQGPDSDWQLRGYLDHSERSHFFLDQDHRDQFDLELQRRLVLDRHDWVLGGGYRYSRDDTEFSDLGGVRPQSSDEHLFSLFVQDEIALAEALRATLGARLEHNDHTGWELQPSARMLWHPGTRQTLWGAVSRAVRTPARIDRDLALLRGVDEDLVVAIQGNPDMSPEILIAYELGHRWQPARDLFLDTALFYNDYDDLRSLEPGEITREWPDLPGERVLPLVVDNRLEGFSYGLELSANWQVRPDWRLQLGYSYLEMNLWRVEGSHDISEQQDENDHPRHQLRLGSRLDIGPRWMLDATLRHASEIKRNDVVLRDLGAYTVMDLRLAWRPRKGLELSLVGRNLFHGPHREFTASTFELADTEIGPSWYLALEWRGP